MTNILLYIPPPYKVSGGLGNFKLFFDICKKLGYAIYFCPLLKNIPSIGFNTQFNDRNIESISHIELINYYIKCPEPVDKINPLDIVTPTMLKARNNVVIYAEDVIGNPAQQAYVVRWLFFFPIPEAVKFYNFEKDYIWFYSDYIYNFYKYLCAICKCQDFLTNNIKIPNICRVFKFDPNAYSSIKRKPSLSNIDMKTSRKSFTTRKMFPPASFSKVANVVNLDYVREIMMIHNKNIATKINKLNVITVSNKIYIQKLRNEITFLKNNVPNIYSQDCIRQYLENKYSALGFENIGPKQNTQEFINLFLTKDFFLSFDPFTFMSIIASLSGCVSVVKKIGGLNFEEWVNGDPFNKYGIAYGQEGIEHALKTHHLLLPHITEMYSQNNNNILNFITNIETRFNITIQKC